MQELIIAAGLFLVIEGLVYALFPAGLKRMAEMLPSIPDQTLRLIGLGSIALGVLIVWMVKG